jgi:LysM repeat protein
MVSRTAVHALIRRAAGLRLPFALLAASALAGCASPPPGGVQVVERGQHQGNAPLVQRQPVRSGHYVVQRGDTLYSIAFRFGWDWKALAAHNGLRDPYLIRVGQVIRFDNRTTPAQPVAATVPPAGAEPPAAGHGAGFAGEQAGTGQDRSGYHASHPGDPFRQRLGLARAGYGDRAFLLKRQFE